MSIIWEVTGPIEIFYCYAHEDDELREMLEKHLRILKRQGYIVSWYDRMINPGREWAHDIDVHLKTAQIILLLISPDFLDSDYCFDREMQQALERHHSGDAVVIPIILRPVYWQDAPFSKLQVLPKDGRPVTKWPDRDEAFENITQGIVKVVKELLAQHRNLADKHKSSTSKQSSITPSDFQERGKQWHFAGQNADERVCIVARTHYLFLAQPLFTRVFFLLASVIGTSVFHLTGVPAFLIPGITLLIGLMVIIRTLITWWSHLYIITNKRILSAQGLFAPIRRDIPLESIQQVGIEISSLLSTRLEYGNIRLYLPHGDTFLMKHIPAPRRVRDAIKDLRFGEKQETIK